LRKRLTDTSHEEMSPFTLGRPPYNQLREPSSQFPDVQDHVQLLNEDAVREH
jgi:hypothetical protein